MSIRRELIKGTLWTAVGRYSNYTFQIAVSTILARLLGPSDFGVVSMVVVYTGFVDLLAEFGISATVVQKRYLDRGGLSTIFWLATFIALLLTAVSILLAPVIETFFSFDGLRLVVQVMSVKLLLAGLSTVPQGLMQQRLAFKQLAVLEILTAILSGIVAIFLAFRGWGYWALVVQGVSIGFLRLIGLFFYTRWVPLLMIQGSVIRDVLGFSGHVLAFQGINYWARNADNLLIGRFLGATQLGFYNQAYKLMMYPIQMLTSVIAPSIQPVFATVQDEPHKMAPTYLHIIESIALITFPLGTFLTLFAGPFIRVLWGNQWSASIPIFEVLAVLTMFQPVVSTSGSVFLARNQAKLLFRLGTVNAFIMVAGIVAGLRFGLVGVAAGYAISYLLVVFPLTMYYLARTLHEKPVRVFTVFAKPALILLILLPVLFGFRMLEIPWGDIGMLGSATIVVFVIGFLGGYCLYRDSIKSTIKTLKVQYIK